MKFNLSGTKGAAEAGRRLAAGIHNAKFMGVDRGTVEGKDGSVYDVITLKVNIDGYGEYTQNFFIPEKDEDAERTEGAYGPNPSKLEHFLISVREIIGAVDPAAVEAMDNDKPIMVGDDEVKLEGSTTQFVNAIKKITNPHIGEEVEVKLLPGSNGFVSMPGFPARITRKGDIGIQTVFIGHNLTLSQSEQRRITAAQNAAPTPMASEAKKDELLDGLRKETDADGDLPF